MEKIRLVHTLFEDLINSGEVDKLVTNLQKLTGIPIGINDARELTKGKRYCTESEFSPICQLIRNTTEGRAACLATDLKNFHDVLDHEYGTYYLCHAGLIDFMVPIIIENKHIATINCGQILPEPHSDKGFRKIAANLKSLNLSPKALRKAYNHTIYLPPEKIEAILGVLEFFASYCGEMGRRLKKQYVNQKYQHYEVFQAIEYIQKHFREPIKFQEVADHVYLSPSYFSRLFTKVYGETFTEFLQQIRIGEAKKLLQETDWPITQIGFDVGFNSIPYFYQCFKKTVGCSPTHYRKKLNKF